MKSENTLPDCASKATLCDDPHRGPLRTGRMLSQIQALDAAIFGPNPAKHGRAHMRYRSSTRAFVKKVVNFSCCLGAHAGNFGQIGGRSALDRLERPEMLQERALAGRPDAGDFLQPGLAQVLLAAGAMRANCESMRLVAQALDEVEHRIARLEHERVASGDMKCFPAGVAVGALGHTYKRYVGEAKCRKRLSRGGELAAAAIDDHEIGPGGFGIISTLIAFDVCFTCRLLRYPLPLRERVPEQSEGG